MLQPRNHQLSFPSSILTLLLAMPPSPLQQKHLIATPEPPNQWATIEPQPHFHRTTTSTVALVSLNYMSPRHILIVISTTILRALHPHQGCQ